MSKFGSSDTPFELFPFLPPGPRYIFPRIHPVFELNSIERFFNPYKSEENLIVKANKSPVLNRFKSSNPRSILRIFGGVNVSAREEFVYERKKVNKNIVRKILFFICKG
jgi:hypothetical protein